MRLKKILAGISWLAGGAMLLGIAALALSSFFEDMCANNVIKEVVSPDGKKRVVVFERNCGATTDFSTQASLVVSHPVVSAEIETWQDITDATNVNEHCSGIGKSFGWLAMEVLRDIQRQG